MPGAWDLRAGLWLEKIISMLFVNSAFIPEVVFGICLRHIETSTAIADIWGKMASTFIQQDRISLQGCPGEGQQSVGRSQRIQKPGRPQNSRPWEILERMAPTRGLQVKVFDVFLMRLSDIPPHPF